MCELNTLDLHALFKNEDYALEFAGINGMFHIGRACDSAPACKGVYKIESDSSEKTKYRLRCSVCREKKSLLHKTIFTNARINISTVFHLLYCWANEYSCHLTSHECKVSLNTVTNYFKKFRQACKYQIDKESHHKIGGPGMTVEIDETVMSKRKYNSGRLIKATWVFGGICRETGEKFAQKVPNRKEVTLLPLIQKYIAPGSTIHSDGWKGYMNINSLPESYTHLRVNHKKNFVDPETGSHIQEVERMWKELKSIKVKYRGIQIKDIDLHIAEFLWRSKYKINHNNSFPNAIILVKNCPYG